VSPYSGEIVLFSGVLETPRTLGELQFELPRQVKSLKQCAAWIVWNLDQHSSRGTFRPARDVGWIDEGRQNQRLLPWVMSRAEYEARPQCTVQRDWLRLALKTLGKHLASLPDDGIVVFSFDGSVFSIRCDKKVIAFPGEGLPWTVCFKVEAKTLRRYRGGSCANKSMCRCGNRISDSAPSPTRGQSDRSMAETSSQMSNKPKRPFERSPMSLMGDS
jgi:hypothetical protein